MKTFLHYIKNHSLLTIFIALSLNIQAQDVPFNCDYNAYLFQYNDVYAIDLASGNSYLVKADVAPGNINAAAYNPADGYIWGSLKTPEKTIIRIGKNFNTTTYYIDELPTSSRYVGDVNAEGMYFLKGSGKTYYKIDLNPDSANYTKHSATESLSQNINIHDWAFNAVDGNLYTVEKGTNILYRINPLNGAVVSLGEVPILSGLNYTYGAVYFDLSGRFYVSANQTGTIYVIASVQDLTGANAINSNLFAFGPSSSSNDGARCPTAPVPQEICDNGIDDDGDGLIDCEDPSCSGYGSCPTVEAPTSGSNDGGLESNNRLSEQINRRNFNRAKNNYKFDRASAKRVVKSSKYGKKSSTKNGYELKDFIPLNVINEDYVVETSPTDLLTITNATSVYSVDYMKNDKSVASILALKTEDNVYEHTKYICDRLLGAEMISISTMDINEQSFIKSIIKNVDGSIEYALSLSVKETSDNVNFAVESHWNLDKYESGVPFYNFQIWASSIDGLLLLAEEVVALVNGQKPIIEYNNSTPPTVFVRKGKYINGKLDLQIVNTNETESVVFDAGMRTTETTTETNIASVITLNQNYITDLNIETGNLFDIGFRIGDGIATPDDLFMSDGPWGYDDSPESTVVDTYTILENNIAFDENDFPIERNASLKANTKDYVALYRAITPRFQAADLTGYKYFKLKAKGTGDLQITFVKKSIDDWELQYKTTIKLTENLAVFNIPLEDFTSTAARSLVLDDVVTIVFTMVSQDGTLVTKEMNLEDISFSNEKTLAIESTKNIDLYKLSINPNPMDDKATLYFNAETSEQIEVLVYNQIGKLVKQQKIDAVIGNNEIKLERDNLNSGLYFCKLISKTNSYKTLKILMK